MPAEAAHEIGRRGLIQASIALDQVFGDAIDLPFNAYDHPEKLTFDDPSSPGGIFSFDLSGSFRRPDPNTISGQKTVELFVEVKNHDSGTALQPLYSEFLRRASVVGAMPRYRESWFIFVSSVPFGTTAGVRLCDGSFLTDCCQKWKGNVKPPEALHLRTALVFANLSLRRALEVWKQPR